MVAFPGGRLGRLYRFLGRPLGAVCGSHLAAQMGEQPLAFCRCLSCRSLRASRQTEVAPHQPCGQVKNFAVIYLVDITEVPDFNKMYELYDPCTVMFFFRNKHIMIDLGTGNNNKINWAMEDKQEMIDIIETVYRGARKGRGLVVSPKDYSTKYRY
ncbi:thioredoxin-like protein 4A isoform X1 [Panthera tigris]|uniref:thioredoxin-like protein 4A isoform X1 n=1 Tax=Panthera leo TaxID=9689 RepID=UPI001C699947|nr:thioredoxin-like protein 4A isoform X1 [Panthera leo]XP_042818511.1 thioredoxin-like protein 4A isoform X1 [Panthera tigris]